MLKSNYFRVGNICPHFEINIRAFQIEHLWETVYNIGNFKEDHDIINILGFMTNINFIIDFDQLVKC